MGATLSLNGVTKRFGSLAVLEDLNLEIGAGEFVSLLGPSGCGKTTTLNLLAGLFDPDEGEIRRQGELISSANFSVPPERRRFSMMFQSYALWPHKTVFENVAYGLRLRRVDKSAIENRVNDILRSVHMEGYGQRYPSELSGGQQQRIALARALVVEPDVLLMDEPLSNLDSSLREAMRFEIRRLHEKFNITSVYVTHDQTEAMVMSDRVVVMNRGRRQQFDRPEEIFHRPINEFVAGFVGRMNFITVELLGDGVVSVAGNRVRARAGMNCSAAVGAQVRLGFRPHDVSVELADAKVASLADPELNAFRIRIDRSVFVGHAREYSAFIEGMDGEAISITAPPDAPAIRQGESALLRVAPEKCHLFDVTRPNQASA